MRNKMITLCPTTYEKASKIKNFSGWIRWCITHRQDLLNVQETINDLEEENKRLQALINDVIDGKKRFVPGKGWIKNMYEVEEE